MSRVDDICKNHVGPLRKKISAMENGIATNVAIYEDARARLAFLDEAKDTIEEMAGKFDELVSASQQQKEMMELFRGLCNDVTRILEDRSAPRGFVQDTAHEDPEHESNDKEPLPRSGQRIAASASNRCRPGQGDAVSVKPSSRKTNKTNTRSKKSTRSAPEEASTDVTVIMTRSHRRTRAMRKHLMMNPFPHKPKE